MDPDIGLTTPLAVLALMVANAYFVMAEFVLLTMHRARFEPQTADGDNATGRIPPVLESPGSLLLTAQVGSSLSTVAIGFVIAIGGLLLGIILIALLFQLFSGDDDPTATTRG